VTGRARASSVAATRELADIEHWFVERGLPHFVERRDSATQIWGRALPLLVVAYGLLGLNALKVTGRAWTLGQNLGAAAFAIAVLAATWVIANRMRGRGAFERPRSVGPGELAVFIVAPAIPSILFGQWSDGLETVIGAVVILAVLWALTSYGIWPLLRWAWQRTVAQLALLFNVVVRALPLLLLFTTFLFINAEVWQVAGTLDGVVYIAVLGIFFVLGAVFILSRVPALMHRLNQFDSWDEIDELVEATPAASVLDGPGGERGHDGAPIADRPTLRQRFNIGLVTIFSQAIQITLVAAVIGAFFVLFGVLAIPEATIRSWTAADPVHVFARLSVGSRELVLSEPLVRVAGFLAAFTGMYFTVQLTTDAAYRDEFAEDVGPQLRQALAVRCVYRRALGSRSGKGEMVAP
jgi:hypothetical protein